VIWRECVVGKCNLLSGLVPHAVLSTDLSVNPLFKLQKKNLSEHFICFYYQ